MVQDSEHIRKHTASFKISQSTLKLKRSRIIAEIPVEPSLHIINYTFFWVLGDNNTIKEALVSSRELQATPSPCLHNNQQLFCSTWGLVGKAPSQCIDGVPATVGFRSGL